MPPVQYIHDFGMSSPNCYHESVLDVHNGWGAISVGKEDESKYPFGPILLVFSVLLRRLRLRLRLLFGALSSIACITARDG
ncbi:hypothetical protein N7541_005223 [Penicillium brevicompactum]|uniref:Uncharacterized protein n=1 Tax=Penicillium brevicompactum TaxID=5074 RepID=A0A9W9REI7_PENBR|nr:hypothetical protein N7541_005223 [Penicillium brevicompactum]